MNSSLTPNEVLIRLLAAALAGALIGLERETHGRPAGLRTTILACVASALSMIVSEALFVSSGTSTAWRPDPARLGAGILTGIGFLGAGTIMRHSNVIRGVTTAASLWFATVLGLALGSGLYFPAGIGLAIAMISLMVLPGLEKHIPSDWYSTLTLVAGIDAVTEQELRTRLDKLHLKPKRVKMRYDLGAQLMTISVEVQFKRQHAVEMPSRLFQELRSLPGVREMRWV